ncbi:MAG: hypothetical protein ACO3CQ_00410 [Candidatus Nanopelagicaceae bacterium]
MLIKNSLPSHYCEISHTRFIAEYLKNEFDDNYHLFFIHPDLDLNANLMEEFLFKLNEVNSKNIKKIAIHVGNEEYYDDKFYKNFDMIFRNYHYNRSDNSKVFNFSLGYNSSGNSVIEFDNSKKISERTIDVFFSGQIGHRESFYHYVTNNLRGNYQINFNGRFRGGIDIDDYIKTLSNTKICLVPNGLSKETFRYAEAFASGCVVITTENINVWYYENSPAYFVNNWNQVTDEYIQNILQSNLDIKQTEGIRYYKKYLSPESSAKYIISKIRNKFQ